MDEWIDILDVLYLFYKKKVLIIGSGLLVAIVVFLYAELFVTPTYTASIQVYVRNSEERLTTIYEGSDANAARSLVSTCIIILQDTDVLQKIADVINEEKGSTVLNGSTIRSMLTMTQVDTAEILKIQAVYADPVIAAQVCNVLAYEVAPEIMEEVIGFSPVQPLSKSQVPAIPSYPKATRWVIYGGAVGVAMAMAVILVLCLLDNTIKNGKEIKERFNLPVLGQIPDFLQAMDKKRRGKHGKQRSISLAAVRLSDSTSFGIKEAYKGLRSNLAYVLGTKKSKVMVISSPGPGESKSTTTANLAISIAESGKKVLIIDADMRKPSQHRIFSLKNKDGLSSLLAEMTKVKLCIQREVIPNLDILPSGPLPPNPSELLGTKIMESLIKATESVYDIVLIDTPPINVVSDLFAMNANYAGVLLVSRQGKTTINAMQSAIARIELSDSSILGVVISGWEERERLQKYDYLYKYEYMSKEEPKVQSRDEKRMSK